MVWEQKVQPDYAHAAAAAVTAGNDMVMTTPHFYEGRWRPSGDAVPGRVRSAVARILTLKFDLGLFENPRLLARARRRGGQRSAHRPQPRGGAALARAAGERRDAAARRPPLTAADPIRVAVVGPLADDAQTQLGDWAGGSGRRLAATGSPAR
jgi:beta-glucosidase